METLKNIVKGIGAMLFAALCILAVGVPAAVICFVVKWVLNV